ncbi:PEP-utilizing enzyme [uncultured Alsobacter sp.]|uniref:PEP-utilizing enzyme n=1 Tax=uncultured Alsobacter sp. TaxID=1748258 RepID=UPI0025D9512A|nr:PEP-utilizing enzyme [uncultured Alsobacter sp.]
MAGASTTGLADFAPPGPGTWLLDAVHMPRPFTRFQQAIHPPALDAGFRETMARYGVLVATLDYKFINGLGYFQPVPAPPEEIPARIAAAQAAVEKRIWRADLDRWLHEVKPASIVSSMALQRIDPAALGDAALHEHIGACIAHLSRMVRQHHSFNGAAILPVGDFIASVVEWSGQPAGQFLSLLRGAAPESAGSFPELDSLVEALRSSASGREILFSGDAGAALSRLRAAPGDVGAAATAYLDLVSWRLLDSLDAGDPTAIEMPEVLASGIRRAVEDGAPAAAHAGKGEEARLRDLIPDGHKAAYDDLLAETRMLSRLRDERGLYSDVWAAGLARRALLEAGRRLVEAGRLHEPAHLIEGDPAEIDGLIRGRGGPDADELAERCDVRMSLRATDGPPFLGEPPHPPPPLDGLPPATVRMMRALGTAIDAIFAPSHAASEDGIVRGTAASPGTYKGTARLIAGPHEFTRIQRGDVLVTATTTEAFNIVLPLLGAMVTDAGGLLSHAAIVSREYGIPGVVGCLDATARIPDGATVSVDGTTGEVRVL